MLKFYKLKRKEFYECQIRSHIKYNLIQIREYKLSLPSEPDDDLRFENYPAIAKSYDSKVLEQFKIKYNVDSELIHESIKIYDLTIEEYNNFTARKDVYVAEVKEREKINCYKKAILELKQEGLI